MAVELIAYIMSVVVAVTIVLSIKVMGIILLLSLLSMPAVIANSLTKDYRRMAALSAVIAVVCNIVGFLLSYAYDLPTGSSIIFTLGALLLIVKVLYRSKRV